MKFLSLFTCLILFSNLYSQNLADGTLRKEFIKEALAIQSLSIEIESLFLETQQLFKKGDYLGSNNLLTVIIAKLPLLNLPSEKLAAKLKKFRKYNSLVYMKWGESILSEKNIDLDKIFIAEEKLDKALVFSQDYQRQVDLLKLKVLSERKKINRQKSINLKGIIGLNGSLNPESNGVARRQYLISVQYERGIAYYDAGAYEKAIREFETMLILDPYDSRALKYMENCYSKLESYGNIRRELAIEEFITAAGWKWARGFSVQDNFTKSSQLDTQSKKTLGLENIEKLKGKLDIILPSFQVRDVRVGDVLERLRALSKNRDEEKVGVNFIIKNLDFVEKGEKVINEINEDPFVENVEEEEIDSVTNKYLKIEDREISIDLKNIPIRDVLGYIVSVAKLKYKVEKFAVLITDINDPGDDLSTSFFPASASFLEVIEEGSEGEDEVDIKEYFESLGVSFPSKSQIRYVSAVNRLVVTNTQDNLRRVEELLKELNVAPKQILIEAKFIDIVQNDLDEVGFQWFFEVRDPVGGDLINLNPGHANISFFEQENGSDVNISNVIRNSTEIIDNPFSSTEIPRGEQLRLITFLDRIRYETLIRLLDKKLSTNLLSAPRISTINGETARIRIVQERYFPESWEPAEVVASAGRTIITPSAPQFAPPRDIGVSLEVTPQINVDGYSVQLQLSPEVTEFLSYDIGFNRVTDIQGQSVTLRYDVPIISIRKLETTILLYDGETVSLGGLIREKLSAINDRVPFLSNLPFVGRLFVSKSLISEKVNFLVFVSVRLISPSGVPIRSSKTRGLPDFN